MCGWAGGGQFEWRNGATGKEWGGALRCGGMGYGGGRCSVRRDAVGWEVGCGGV